MKTKENFHKLIDKIDDEKALKAYYELIQRLNKNHTGDLWNSLNENEKKELLLSYNESFYPENSINHSLVKEQHKKWLKK